MRFLAPHRPKRRRAPFPFFTQNESLQDKSHVLGSSRSLFLSPPKAYYGLRNPSKHRGFTPKIGQKSSTSKGWVAGIGPERKTTISP